MAYYIGLPPRADRGYMSDRLIREWRPGVLHICLTLSILPAYDLSASDSAQVTEKKQPPSQLGCGIGRAILSFTVFLVAAGGAFGQTTFGSQAVGAPTSQTVTVTARTVAAVQVLTMGIANLDYTAGSGACASASLAGNQPCSHVASF